MNIYDAATEAIKNRSRTIGRKAHVEKLTLYGRTDNLHIDAEHNWAPRLDDLLADDWYVGN